LAAVVEAAPVDRLGWLPATPVDVVDETDAASGEAPLEHAVAALQISRYTRRNFVIDL
jgi:hypothetical protein